MDILNEKFFEDGSYLMPLDKYPLAEKYCWMNDWFGVWWKRFLPPRRSV